MLFLPSRIKYRTLYPWISLSTYPSAILSCPSLFRLRRALPAERFFKQTALLLLITASRRQEPWLTREFHPVAQSPGLTHYLKYASNVFILVMPVNTTAGQQVDTMQYGGGSLYCTHGPEFNLRSVCIRNAKGKYLHQREMNAAGHWTASPAVCVHSTDFNTCGCRLRHARVSDCNNSKIAQEIFGRSDVCPPKKQIYSKIHLVVEIIVDSLNRF
jgi:hypothetical protein